MSRWAAPAAVGGVQLLVGLVFLAVGIGYDYANRAPGLLTIAALIFMGGPGFAWALREAQRSRMVQGGQRAEIVERREMIELEDPRRGPR
ncbi:MAG: hypothetical protein EKK62_16515 [Acidimicrobiia bacterium]|nr:MAG: hypothetical protein EKK62_16515 [Acidimicrobiia bacterium]